MQVEPGTVILLGYYGSPPLSRTPYDKKVGRLISGGGGYKSRIVWSRQEKKKTIHQTKLQ